jgi:hypothetical protein
VPTANDTSSFSFRWPLIALTTIVAAYVWYVVNQYGRLNDLNQAELANAAAELNRAIENAFVTVTNFKMKPAPSDDPLCDFDRDQPYLDFVPSCPKHKRALTTGVGFSQRSGLTVAKALDEKGDMDSLMFRADVVLGELSLPESFRLIFLADDRGVILYQDEPAARRWLRQLRWGEQAFRDSAAAGAGGLQIQNLKEALAEGKEAEWNKIRSMSARTSLRLGGKSYQVYLQPVTLEEGELKDFVLGGAVPNAEVLQQALAVDTYFMALLIFLFLLGSLGFPFVKLIVLDQRERFRMHDVYLLYLSSAALLVLLTFVVLGLDAYARWYSIADTGLKSLAKNLEHQFRTELSAVRDQLATYNQELSELHSRRCEYLHGNWFNKEDDTFKLPPRDRHIYLETLTWVSPTGDQKWKLTANKNAKNLSVAQRPYYRAARDKNLFQIDGNGESFFLAPDRSITDGKFKTFISMRLKLKEKFCDTETQEGDYIAVAVVKLLSLDRVSLPAGYGFAVVNREGRVLYHSDARLSLRENILSEISDGSVVKALLYAGQKGFVKSRYRERPHEFFFLPVDIHPESPADRTVLHLAVFRDLSAERVTVAHAFMTSLAAAMVFLLFILPLGISFASRFKRRHWSVWLWPHGGLVRFYQQLTFVSLSVLVACLLLSHWVGEIVFLFMPALAAVSGILVCVSRNWPAEARVKMEGSFWQTSEIILLSLCIVIVPSMTLFRLTVKHNFGKMIATERKWIEDQNKDSELALKAEERAEGYGPMVGERRVNDRNFYFNNKYPEPYDNDGSDSLDSPLVIKAHEWMDQALPIENDIAARQRYQASNKTYSPPYLFGDVGIVALVGLAATIGLLLSWIRWNTNHLFYADLDSPHVGPASPDRYEAAWNGCEMNEKILLIQIARERMANPYQRPMVIRLMNKGLLRLAPDLQPSSEEFTAFLLSKEQSIQHELQGSQRVAAHRSWRYVRPILVIAVAGLALFVVTTQPIWPSILIGIAGGTASLLTALLKLQDVILQWMKNRNSAG